MSTATFASACACSRPWWAQKSSSPESGSRTRTYACAPQRSHRSSAFSGLVGAVAPVTSPSPGLMPPAAPSGWLRFAALSLTEQHNTYPGVRLPVTGGCTPQAKTALTAPLADPAAQPGDYTTVWVVTGEVPVRFVWLIPNTRAVTHLMISIPSRSAGERRGVVPAPPRGRYP